MQSGVGFLAWGGCNGFKSDDPVGAPGTWYRYFNGSFSEPGVGGKQSCLPGIPGGDGGASCPIVHWNTGLFGCLSSLPTFLLSCVCPCVVAGQLGEHIGTPRSARDATRPPANGSSTG